MILGGRRCCGGWRDRASKPIFSVDAVHGIGLGATGGRCVLSPRQPVPLAIGSMSRTAWTAPSRLYPRALCRPDRPHRFGFHLSGLMLAFIWRVMFYQHGPAGGLWHRSAALWTLPRPEGRRSFNAHFAFTRERIREAYPASLLRERGRRSSGAALRGPLMLTPSQPATSRRWHLHLAAGLSERCSSTSVPLTPGCLPLGAAGLLPPLRRAVRRLLGLGWLSAAWSH